MPNYLLSFGGTLGGSFPWSCNASATSTSTEAAVESAWDGAIAAMWNTTAFADLIPATTTLTYTSTSTASVTWKQTTKTQIGHSIAGLATTPSLPYQLCEIVTFRSNEATKAGRGRWYLPAMATAAIAASGDVLSATAQAAVQSAVNAMFAGLGSTVQLLLLHRKATLSGDQALSANPIARSDCSNKMGVQRRRGDKLVPTRLTITV